MAMKRLFRSLATTARPASNPSLLERLKVGPVLCGEGYLFELERRGYVKAGPYVPLAVLHHPDAVTQLHREYVRAGSDIVEAFTYYAHKEKLRLVGHEDSIEELNRSALRLAKKVADESNCLMAGNISNSNIYVPDDPEIAEDVRQMFVDQVRWAKEEGADFVIAETLNHTGEAMIALDVIKSFGMTSVITLVVSKGGYMFDGDDPCPVKALVRLKEAGADVVGFNCGRGPATMLPIMEEASKCAELQGMPLAALPVGYSTTAEQPTMQTLCCPQRLYTDADHHVCTRYEFADFALRARELGFNYLGTCCGGAPHHVRSMAEALGKPAEGLECSPDVSQHFAFGFSSDVEGDAQGITALAEETDKARRIREYYKTYHEHM